MPRGAAPGERRGGRSKSAANKLTVGRRHIIHYGFSLDGSLHELSKLLIATVKDPAAREAIVYWLTVRERPGWGSGENPQPRTEAPADRAGLNVWAETPRGALFAFADLFELG